VSPTDAAGVAVAVAVVDAAVDAVVVVVLPKEVLPSAAVDHATGSAADDVPARPEQLTSVLLLLSSST
jgi:hypothetical protein